MSSPSPPRSSTRRFAMRAGARSPSSACGSGSCARSFPSRSSFYFEIVGRDTLCEGAKLELELIDALMSCGSCGHEWDPEPQPEHGSLVGGELLMPQFRCPRCEAAGAEVLRGNELEVESIEVGERRRNRASAGSPDERCWDGIDANSSPRS